MKKSLLTALGFVFASSAALAQGGPDFCSPQAITGAGVWAYDTSLPGTTESGLLTTGNPCGSAVPANGSVDSLHKDVVFAWTVPAPLPGETGEWLFHLCSTTNVHYDTKMAFYLNVLLANCGDPWTAGNAVICNEDGSFSGCTNFASSQQLGGPCDGPLVPGDTYMIQCGGFDQIVDVGPAELTITPIMSAAAPANDTCAGATPLAMGPNAVSNVDACVSGLEPTGLPPFLSQATPDTACEDFGAAITDQLFNDTYNSFTAPNSGDFRFSTCDMASYDSKVAIYSGSCGSLTPLACNDDGPMCAAFSTELNVTGLTGGQTYTVQLGGFNGVATGTATMEVSETFPPSLGTPFCPGVANSTGAASEMTASGSLSVAANDLVITANNLPGGQVGVFFYAPNQLNGGAGLPFGDGLRCAGGTVFRIFPPTPVVANAATKTVNNTLPSGAGIGAFLTQHFQFWYRDRKSVV